MSCAAKDCSCSSFHRKSGTLQCMSCSHTIYFHPKQSGDKKLTKSGSSSKDLLHTTSRDLNAGVRKLTAEQVTEAFDRFKQKHSQISAHTFSREIPYYLLGVKTQAENGLITTKRFYKSMTKFNGFRTKYYLGIKKVVSDVDAKTSALEGKDEMSSLTSAWDVFLKEHEKLAKEGLSACENIDSELKNTVGQQLTSSDASIRRIMKTGRQELEELSEIEQNIAKSREKSMNELETLMEAMGLPVPKAVTKNSPPLPKSPKRSKKLGHRKSGSFFTGTIKKKMMKKLDTTAMVKQCYNTAEEYHEQLESGNHFLVQHVTQKIRPLMNELQKIEEERILTLKKGMGSLIQEYERMIESLSASVDSMKKAYDLVDEKADVDRFVAQTQRDKSVAKYVPFEYELPLSLKEIEEILEPPAEKKPQDALFATKIVDLMERQKESHPELTVPRICDVLVKKILELKSCEKDGIFRQSADYAEMKRISSEMENGDYSCNTDNPHNPTGLLKKWLRDLAEPLFPDDVYADCLDAGKHECLQDATTKEYVVACVCVLKKTGTSGYRQSC